MAVQTQLVVLLFPLPPLALYSHTNAIVNVGPMLFGALLAENAPASGEGGVTCIPTAVLAQAEMLVHQHGSCQNKGRQGCIVSLRKMREDIFFSTLGKGKKIVQPALCYFWFEKSAP